MKKQEKYEIEGITNSMAYVDSLPVLFFMMNSLLIGILFKSWLFMIGAIGISLGGICKVLWKFLMASKHQNIYILNQAFKKLMIIGFSIVLLSLVLDRNKIHLMACMDNLICVPQCIFFFIGICGMILMMIYRNVLDISKAKSNWIAQITNAISQFSFFIGLLLIKFF